MVRKSRVRVRDLFGRLGSFRRPSAARSLARALFKSRLLAVFFLLCLAGIAVAILTWNDSTPADAELFGGMNVVSFRDSPADTTTHFVVDLCAGGKPFRRYDVDADAFIAPPHDRDYNRAITGTVYRPLEVRGHVAQGLWLDVPRAARPDLLPEQFDELYRATLDYVKPVSLFAGAIGTLSGYSIGYRLASWSHSLQSRSVQERVLATPGLGRRIAREAWRRVLLEPLVTGAEDDAQRFAATAATQRIYTNFFRLALNDSDGFIPREAERLASLGHAGESRAMLAFAAAVHRAQVDAPVTSGDFDAVERWASLLVRRGHWATGAIPPPGEERSRYLGTLAWYGVAPPSPGSNRIWIGPRLLVREGDIEGFVTDDVPATGVGCPAGWRTEIDRPTSGTSAWATAWLADHSEFRALGILATRVGATMTERARATAARPAPLPARPPARVAAPVAAVPVADDRPTVLPVVAARVDSASLPRESTKLDTTRASLALPADTVHVPAAPADTTRADSAR